jgi:YegS/Rv2252/BmrU family lipid kinase
VNETFLTVVNPAAGGGRCRKLVGPALDLLRSAGLKLEIVETASQGDATRITRDAYARGFRKFLAVGGDGTSYEIVNGLFPANDGAEVPVLGFLPLGTGNSFLRDFTKRGVEGAMEALIAQRSHPCDVLRLRHTEGVLHYINLLSVGFAADVNATRCRTFAGWGEAGYFLSIFLRLAQLHRRPFPLRVNEDDKADPRRCLFLSFNNSKFTGGTMMIAPNAEVDDGLIEYVRWGPIGRIGLIRNLSTLYDGTHVNHPLAERRSARRIQFELDGKVDVMVDGEALTLHLQELDVLPSALRVVV